MTTKITNVSIYANMTDDDPEGDFLAEQGVDILLPEGVSPGHVMSILFDGFEERLRNAGLDVKMNGGGWT